VALIHLKRQRALQRRFLRAQPGKEIAALPAQGPRPAQVLERRGVGTGPPVFFGDHERPAVPAAAGEGKYFDDDPVPGACEAVPFALELDAIMRPARSFQSGVAGAHQQVKHPEE